MALLVSEGFTIMWIRSVQVACSALYRDPGLRLLLWTVSGFVV